MNISTRFCILLATSALSQFTLSASVELPLAAFPGVHSAGEIAVLAMKQKAEQRFGYWKATDISLNGLTVVNERYLDRSDVRFPLHRSETRVFAGKILRRSSTTVENATGKWVLFPDVGAAVKDPIRSSQDKILNWESPLMGAYKSTLTPRLVESPANGKQYHEIVMELDSGLAKKLSPNPNVEKSMPRKIVMLIDGNNGTIMGYSIEGSDKDKVVREYYAEVGALKPDANIFSIPKESELFFARNNLEARSAIIHYERLSRDARALLRKKTKSNNK